MVKRSACKSKEIRQGDINEMVLEMTELIPKLWDPGTDSEEKAEAIVEFLAWESDDEKIHKGLVLLTQLLIFVKQNYPTNTSVIFRIVYSNDFMRCL